LDLPSTRFKNITTIFRGDSVTGQNDTSAYGVKRKKYFNNGAKLI